MIDKIKSVYQNCFHESNKYLDYAFKEKFSLDNCLFAEEGGDVVSEMFVMDRKLCLRGTSVECPYIVGVCTLPEHRRKGLADMLLNRSFDQLKEKGFAICALHPFRHNFYEKFGFVTYNKVKSYSIVYDKLIADIYTKPAKESDCDILLKIYNKYMMQYNGYACRDLNEMIRRYRDLNSDGNCEFIVVGGDIKGYLFYDEEKFIAEFCGEISYLKSLKEFDSYTVNLPIDQNNGELTDFTMIKILDRDKLISVLKLEKYRNLLLPLDDSQLVHALMGSYGEFDIELNDDVKAIFCEKTNYIFDKY